ncbi:MAG: metallophosphoesterase family protein [Bacteroidia bacterium]|nr:metallophosphoesterase family protein [Bacteroidia bacterium]
MRQIAISDIHGCIASLRALVEHQLQLRQDDKLYLLGDYIDRGPNSRGVLDYIMQLQQSGYDVTCLRGNHEQMMLDAVANPREVGQWIYNGGYEALTSFGTDDVTQIPEKYINFLHQLPFYAETDTYILVHAGLNFTGTQKDVQKDDFLWRMHNPLRDTESMLWIRYWYDEIDWNWLKKRIIVHGHTPIEQDEILDMFEVLEEDQVIDIDNGCFAKLTPGLGKLCAFDMSRRMLFFQENID